MCVYVLSSCSAQPCTLEGDTINWRAHFIQRLRVIFIRVYFTAVSLNMHFSVIQTTTNSLRPMPQILVVKVREGFYRVIKR